MAGLERTLTVVTDGPRGVVTRVRLSWQRLRPLLGDRTAPVLVLTGASIAAGLTEAGVLVVVAQVAAAMVAGTSRVTAAVGPWTVHASVGVALALALALAVTRMSLQMVAAWLPSRIAADVQARLRRDLFAAFTRASWAVQAREREGHLQELMSGQIGQATGAVLAVAAALSGAAMFSALVASAMVLNVPVALVVLGSAVSLFALLRPLTRLGQVAAGDLSGRSMDHAAGVNESVHLAEEVQTFGVDAAHRHRLEALIELARDAFFRYQLTGGLSRSLYQGLLFILIVGGLAGLYLTGAGNLATLGAAVLMLVRASTYGQQLQGAYQGLVQILPYLDRLEAVLAKYRASTPTDGARPLPRIDTVSFDEADFSYQPGRPVLRAISFTVHAGETVGIVGPSGAGKSTLVQLLLRLREPDSGSYLINDEPANSFRRADWQRRVAYVPQDPRLLHASVADNIRFFRDLDDAAVRRAAILAHIHDDIEKMPDGYDTVIGQRADAVSGGQRQRICLARALAARPDLLILDEPTSALDLASEAAVQSSLAELHGRMTLFIVAHRLSTLNTCDRVLVMGAGRVEAFAPAAELERTSDFFRLATTLSTRRA